MGDICFGPKADLLPGQETLDQFNDVLPHRLPDSTHVATVPGHSDILLRWEFQDNYYSNDQSRLEALARLTVKHLTALVEESMGALQVPSIRYFAGPAAYIRPGSNGTAMYSVAQKIGGRKLEAWDDPAGEPVVLGLAQYLRWVKESNQPEHLRDLIKPPQHRIVEFNRPYAWTVDTDRNFGFDPRPSLAMLEHWHDSLPESATTNIAREIISQI